MAEFQNPLEMTGDIEEFEDQGEFIDLHITESSFTDETKHMTVSSIASAKQDVSQSSLQSLKSSLKSQPSIEQQEEASVE